MDPVFVHARARDVAGLAVRRVLPAIGARSVGPFVFFDHMGPATLAPGDGVDVPPHPHIGLATVTYLFAGELVHRDTLGSQQTIHPGDVNWMVAGRGIAHSERSGPEARRTGATVHGIQSWVALPRAHEDDAPSFEHHPAATLPVIERPDARLVVIAGTAYGERSPVQVLVPTLYVDARLEPDASLEVDDEHEQRAVYVVDGTLALGEQTIEVGTLVVLPPGKATIIARTGVRAMIVGGAQLDGPRHMWWNYVTSDPARIERAKHDWKHGLFGTIPGDMKERVPLPDR